MVYKKPKGGVLTIMLNNSDINKKESNGGGGFDVSVEEWQNEVEVEIII